MDWQRLNTVYYIPGTVQSKNIAAFDFDGTLAWSDSGLVFMRTEDDWVPTTGTNQLIQTLLKLIQTNWTIAIFTNLLDTNPEFTRRSLERIKNFFTQVKTRFAVPFKPFIYVSTANDYYRKPNLGMWDMFTTDAGIAPSPASFYCGDAFGPQSDNLLYRWSDYDLRFAEACGIGYHTPEEILGTYESISPIDRYKVLLVMAADEVQYRAYIDNLIANDPTYVESDLAFAAQLLTDGRKVIVTGERFATGAGRRRALYSIPRKYQVDAVFLMFTRPIRPFLQRIEETPAIRGYANALDVHPQLHYTIPKDPNMGPQNIAPFKIIRIN